MEKIQLKNITKTYNISNKNVVALKNFSYQFNYGNLYAIIGPSGSGKSTLLKIMGLMLDFDEGEYFINGQKINACDDTQLSEIRMNKIGFIYQDFFLDENLKAYENVMLPMIINNKINKNERRKKALSLLENVGLTDRIDHFPSQLSGGEQQRICIARALANNPNIILADEPTGNLDEENEKIIFSKLKDLCKSGKCVIVVSHSNKILEYADYVLKIEKGKLL